MKKKLIFITEALWIGGIETALVNLLNRLDYDRYDVTCLIITACMTFFFLGHISGLGIGTVLAAFTMGKGVALVGEQIDKKASFVSFLEH